MASPDFLAALTFEILNSSASLERGLSGRDLLAIRSFKG